MFPFNTLTPQALLQSGQIHMANRDTVNAHINFQSILQGFPDHELSREAALMSGIVLNSLGRAGETEALLRSVVDGETQDVIASKAKIVLGISLLQLSKFDQAIQLVAGVAVNRSDEIGAEAQFTTGQILSKSGKYADAIDAYLKVKYLFEAYGNWIARAQIEAALLIIKQGDTPRALSMLKSVRTLHGEDEWGTMASDIISKL
jgi:outer membrane protein assembly factor BamD (BamD/ComL family)